MHTTQITPEHQQTPAITGAGCPFTERFGSRLPRGFADAAAGMDWRELVETFAPSNFHLHLADFVRRPLGRGRHHYEALLTFPDGTTHRMTAEAHGELSAVTEMLHRLGLPLETERFHQMDSDGTWCTILLATDGRRRSWAMGFGADGPASGIAALISAASLIHLR